MNCSYLVQAGIFRTKLVTLLMKETYILFVTEQQNSLMNVCEARKQCRNRWMKEALELLVSRLTSQSKQTKGELFPETECSSSGKATIVPFGCRAQIFSPPLPSFY